MLKKETEQQQAIEMVCTDMLAPKEHLLRKIDAAVDFTRIYELVEELYYEDNGRPSCDPVVLFKLVLIQHLRPLTNPSQRSIFLKNPKKPKGKGSPHVEYKHINTTRKKIRR